MSDIPKLTYSEKAVANRLFMAYLQLSWGYRKYESRYQKHEVTLPAHWAECLTNYVLPHRRNR